MANLKISQLTPGNPAQSGDVIPIERSDVNFSITAGSIAALAPAGVTSVGFEGDGTVLSSTESGPVTGSGILSATLLTQSANLILAGPATGSAAKPTFRSLVSADIPNNAANTSGTASNLSGTPALPNGTTATTQGSGDSSTKLATDAFVSTALENGPNDSGVSGIGIMGGVGLWDGAASYVASYGAEWSANVAYCWLFYVPEQIAITSVGLYCTAVSSSASQYASAGIYSTAGAKLVDSGTFNVSTGQSTGVLRNNITSVTLNRGWYWYVFTTSTAQIGLTYLSQAYASVTILGNNKAVRIGTATATSSGVLNRTLGTVSAANDLYLPLCLLEP